jgi:chemotaxis protein methyltransferase CheR
LAFANDVLPAISEPGASVQVWSAGSANGQEAYSLAMVLAESGLKNWQVIATDISTKALARTVAARYAERELGGLSATRRAQHLVRVAGIRDTWEVAPELRKRVVGLRHNLAADPPPIPAGRCQVVFCRNVLIYFGHDDVVAFLDRLSAWLPAGGHLFLGFSESLWLVSERFHLIRLGDAFIYRNGPAEHNGAWKQPALARRSPTAPAIRHTATPSPPPQPPALSAPTPQLPARSGSASQGVPGLLTEGEAAMGAQDYARAVTAFRKATFLDPDQPVAYLSLGLALEAVGDLAPAQRAFAAARACVDRCDTAAIETTLEGYQWDEFTRLLDLKSGSR